MKWIQNLAPEVGYFIDEVKEERLDGVPKITATLLGMYSVVEPNTVHVVIPINDHKSHHDVFESAHQAREFIENYVINSPNGG